MLGKPFRAYLPEELHCGHWDVSLIRTEAPLTETKRTVILTNGGGYNSKFSPTLIAKNNKRKVALDV